MLLCLYRGHALGGDIKQKKGEISKTERTSKDEVQIHREEQSGRDDKLKAVPYPTVLGREEITELEETDNEGIHTA